MKNTLNKNYKSDVLQNVNKLDANWVTGFVDGEASFVVTIRKKF